MQLPRSPTWQTVMLLDWPPLTLPQRLMLLLV
jgi:hypothetical protein